MATKRTAHKKKVEGAPTSNKKDPIQQNHIKIILVPSSSLLIVGGSISLSELGGHSLQA